MFQEGGSESQDSGVPPSSCNSSPRDDENVKTPRPHSNMSPIHEAADARNYGNDDVFITPAQSQVWICVNIHVLVKCCH